ncbi:DUF3784 domain-containing protein [Mesobacillus subterraneus]|uniref:DUF3784 domain-containing protein n=1 Tax=Mesobacillus subterraneus TaxID=285983 RepID=A0A3R9FF80_9BACI|nr:DUF3784 domain-containing protein [Mesobacillus subterraneus]RSD26649.1 DUF3784 domain-containing protein [Mesobacillus subterraneus]
MNFLLGIQIFLILMFLFFGWAIIKKEWYWLISNFNRKSEDEKQRLIQNGYPQGVGKLMLATAGGMIILLPLSFTGFLYGVEVQFGFMLVFLLGGLIYLTRYEVREKRKRSYIIQSSMAIITIGLVAGLYYFGYQDFELKENSDSFEVTGLYGGDWKYSEIQDVQLLDEMPEVTWRQNGIGLATMSKGQFKVTGYGSSLLFIHKNSSPYLYIETDSKKIFINSKNPEDTREWYEMLSEKTD